MYIYLLVYQVPTSCLVYVLTYGDKDTYAHRAPAYIHTYSTYIHMSRSQTEHRKQQEYPCGGGARASIIPS